MTAPSPRASLESVGRQTVVIDRTASELDLICHVNGKVGWEQKQFSSRKNRLLIGSDQQAAQIHIQEGDADTIQAVACRAGDGWLVMEAAKRDLMSVNGLSSRQTFIRKRTKTVVTIGRTSMVMMVGPLEEQQKQLLPTGPRAVVNFGSQPISVPLDQVFLLGNHPACEVQLERLFPNQKGDKARQAAFDEQFIAAMYHHEGRLFLTPIGKTQMQLDTQPILRTIALPTNGILAVAQMSLPLALPDALKGADIELPTRRQDQFVLLQIDQHGRVLGQVELKKPGSSMMVGRSAQQADLVIDDNEVSRKHAQLIVYEKNILLEDCYSSNGTFVNDEQVGRCRLRAGDLVRFGGSQQFLLCYAFAKDEPVPS